MGVKTNIFVLFISAAPLFIQAKIEFFKSENFQANLYSARRIPTSCETLPASTKNKVKSIRTDTCIILYSNESCVGSYFRIGEGLHPSLPYFETQVQSFGTCTDVSKHEPRRDVRISFYLDSRSSAIVWSTSITPECVNLPFEFSYKAAAVTSDICVILFSQADCIGQKYQVESSRYYTDIWDFDVATRSFMPCNATDIYKAAFMIQETAEAEGGTSQESLETEINLPLPSRAEFFPCWNFECSPSTVEMVTSICANLPYHSWYRYVSIKTEACIILYDRGFCRGNHFLVEAGDSLPEFRKRVVSYRACVDADFIKEEEIEIETSPTNTTNSVAEDSPKIECHSENSFGLIGAIFILAVVVLLLLAWICFIYRERLLLILKCPRHGIYTMAGEEMCVFQTL